MSSDVYADFHELEPGAQREVVVKIVDYIRGDLAEAISESFARWGRGADLIAIVTGIVWDAEIDGADSEGGILVVQRENIREPAASRIKIPFVRGKFVLWLPELGVQCRAYSYSPEVN